MPEVTIIRSAKKGPTMIARGNKHISNVCMFK